MRLAVLSLAIHIVFPATLALAQDDAALVGVAKAVSQEILAERTFVGTVMPSRRSTVGSAVDGRVIEFLVNEGDRVKQGDALCRLRTETLKIELDRALAEVDLRQQELEEQKNGAHPEELAQSKAQMLGAKALRDSAAAKVRRIESLAQRQPTAVTEDELRDLQSSAESAAQIYEAAKANAEMIVAGPREERVLQAAARLEIARQTAKQIEDRLQKHTIRAPFDGYVVEEFTEVGQWISQAEPVVTIVAVDEVEITANVLENYVRHLKAGAPAGIQLPALPSRQFEGRIASVVPLADQQTRQFPVKLRLVNEFENGEPLLKPGMFAQVMLPAGEPKVATLAPKDALFLNGVQKTVFVIDTGSVSDANRGVARAVAVETGVAIGGLIELKSGVNPGEWVAVEGNERLTAGKDVLIVARQNDATPRGAREANANGGLLELTP